MKLFPLPLPARFLLTLVFALPPLAGEAPATPVPAFAEIDGIVAMEAEHAAESHGWTPVATLPNRSGLTLRDTKPADGTGHLRFPIGFSRPGIYTVWALHAKSTDGYRADLANDCVARFNGKPLEVRGGSACTGHDAEVIGLGTHQKVLAWQSRPKTECAADRRKPVLVRVPAPGVYVFEVRSRSEGYLLDKLVLVHESLDFVPTGTGPAETRPGSPQAPASRVP